MTTTRFPQLDQMSREFSRALKADQSPLATAATFWYELLGYNPKLNRALSRGDTSLVYRNGHKVMGTVPGQDFAVEELPDPVCAELMSQHGGTKDGPRLISFRYECAPSGEWRGGYTIETQREYGELVKGRQALDAKFTDALKKEFSPEVERISLTYGGASWKEPGPKLIVSRVGVKEAEFRDPAGQLRALWEELVEYLRGHGVRHLYYANFALDKPSATLREGKGIQLLYCR